MKRAERRKVPADKLTVAVCVAVQLVIAAGLAELYILTNWYILMLLALMLAVPGVTQLVLMLPVGKMPQMPQSPEILPQEETGKSRRLRKIFGKLLKRLPVWYAKARDVIVIVLIAAAGVAGHAVFWKMTPVVRDRLNYVVPVVLAVLFVIHIVMEFWCKAASAKADTYCAAQLKGLRGNFMLMRIAYLLTIAAAVIRLLGLYDACNILKILLGILFVYETVFLAFTLAVRTIRKELRTEPEILVSLIGAGSNTNILGYLEDNTGITMRSLWSLHFVKHLLPVAVMGIAVVIWLSSGFIQILPQQQGALFRFGRLQPEPLRPGLHLTLPWPMDRVEVYDTQSIRKATIGYVPSESVDNIWTKAHGGEEYRLLLGGGEEIVSVNLLVEYRIADLMQYIKSSASPESILQAQAYEIVTARTISTDLDTLLAADRQKFSDSFRKELSEKLSSYEIGLEVVNVVLESIHPPVEIASSYQDIISAGIDAEYFVLLAQTTANRTVMDARVGATMAIGEATAKQHESVAAAQASVAEFMASVEANQMYGNGYRYQKYIRALTQAYGDAKLIIVGEGVDAGNIYIGSLPVQSATVEVPPVPEEGS